MTFKKKSISLLLVFGIIISISNACKRKNLEAVNSIQNNVSASDAQNQSTDKYITFSQIYLLHANPDSKKLNLADNKNDNTTSTIGIIAGTSLGVLSLGLLVSFLHGKMPKTSDSLIENDKNFS